MRFAFRSRHTQALTSSCVFFPQEEELRRCKEAFRETASYFGEDGEALVAAGGAEPANFFLTLNKFVQSIKKARGGMGEGLMRWGWSHEARRAGLFGV